jgi:hypothetical protein
MTSSILNQAVLQLNTESLKVELILFCISVNMVPTVPCQVLELLGVLIHIIVPLAQL